MLDTHAFLWMLLDDRRLSPPARKILADSRNILYLSSASTWEIAIKSQLGRIELPDEPEKFVLEQIRVNGIEMLPITVRHSMATLRLPPIHKDPFDRMLIAQAISEHLPIITADPLIQKYDAHTVW
nr:type II toxin-antitoxin system VapC family toxin [Geotalea sp. SG265]